MGHFARVFTGPMLSTGSPITFSTRPSVWLPTGTSIGMAEAHGLHPAHHAVGGLQRDGAHAAFPNVLRDLDHDVDGRGHVEAFAGDTHGSVDDGDLSLGKLDVDGRTGDLNYCAFYYCRSWP